MMLIHQGLRSKRVWLLVMNLLLLTTPRVVAAATGGGTAGRVALGCCSSMARGAVGATVEGAIRRAQRRPTRRHHLSLEGGPLLPPMDAASLHFRCIQERTPEDCQYLGRLFERADAGKPAMISALACHRRACRLRRSPYYCDAAELAAEKLGCAHAFDCGRLAVAVDMQALKKPDTASEGAARAGAFDPSAAKTAFGRAGETARQHCFGYDELDAATRVTVAFVPSGRVDGVTFEPAIGYPELAGCVYAAFALAQVPPFEGHSMRVRQVLTTL